MALHIARFLITLGVLKMARSRSRRAPGGFLDHTEGVNVKGFEYRDGHSR